MDEARRERMRDLAYDRGYEAGMAEMDVNRSNPYRPGTVDYGHFMEGFRSAIESLVMRALDC
jgi:hypothetical protein